MSEARALTSMISNCVASIVVSLWENACDRDTLMRELEQSGAVAGNSAEIRQFA
jgi:Na+/H+-dicarboxylate symporter